MSAKTGTFEWQGRSYQVERLTAFEMVGVFEEQERFEQAIKDGKVKQQTQSLLAMLAALRCPDEVVKSLLPEEMGDCMVAIQRAQNPFAGEDEDGPPESGGDGNGHPTPPGS